MTAYKVLSKNMTSCHGGRKKWTPGKRHSVRGELAPCRNGLHICRDEKDLLDWLGEVICPVLEHSDEYVDDDNKRVVRWCVIGEPNPYWNERTARHFACDCAEYALRNADESQVGLLQSCIDIARAYADCPEEWSEAYSAAHSAAHSAADLAAYSAAHSAAHSAAYSAAHSAAHSAADLAAYSAASLAAHSAARSASYLAAHSAAYWAAHSAADSDLAAILSTYLDGTNEWVTEGEDA